MEAPVTKKSNRSGEESKAYLQSEAGAETVDGTAEIERAKRWCKDEKVTYTKGEQVSAGGRTAQHEGSRILDIPSTLQEMDMVHMRSSS